MSAIGPVIENFESAKSAESEHNYLRAARYYRICALYYENGELPFYMENVQEYGESALLHYQKCKDKLTRKACRMLDKEESKYTKGSYFISNWEQFVDEEYKRIDEESALPSPNASERTHNFILKTIVFGSWTAVIGTILLLIIVSILYVVFSNRQHCFPNKLPIFFSDIIIVLFVMLWFQLWKSFKSTKPKRQYLSNISSLISKVYLCIFLLSYAVVFLLNGLFGFVGSVFVAVPFVIWSIYYLKKANHLLRIVFVIIFLICGIYIYKTIELPGPMMWYICDRPIDYPAQWYESYSLFRWTTITTAVISLNAISVFIVAVCVNVFRIYKHGWENVKIKYFHPTSSKKK